MPSKKTRLLHQLLKYSSSIDNTWVISPTAAVHSKTERKISRSFPQIYGLQPGLCIFRARRSYQCSVQEDTLASPVIHPRVTSHPHPVAGGEVKTLLGEQGGDSGHRTEHSLQLEEVKALQDSSTRTPLCSMSQAMSDNVRKAAAGLLGWEDMLVVITCWCVLGYHFSSQADGSAIEMRVPKGG